MKRIYLYIAILVKQTLFSGNVPVFSPKGHLPFLYILPAYSLEGSSCFPIGRILVTM